MPPKRDRYAACAALFALLLVLPAGSQAAPQNERFVPLPRPRPPLAAVIPVPPGPVARSERPLPLAIASTHATSRNDLEAVKKAIEAAQKRRDNTAEDISKSIADPVARKLVEWVILRLEDEEFSFQRYSSFITANPGWPNTAMFRRKAEAALWQVPTPPETVRSYFARSRPMTAKGRLAYARALLAHGDRALAQQYVREAWRYDAMTDDLERQALEEFGPLITDSDHKARMDRRFYAEDEDGGMRAAQRLGGAQLAIGKARKAVIERSRHAHALLEAVPESARNDAGYMFSRIQWLRRADKIAEAAQWMNAAPTAPNVILNPEEWWTERRLVARELLDLREYQAAYKIAAEAAEPVEENPRVEAHFTAGWIALRFVKNPAAALAHFTRINQAPGMHPTSIARGHYWMGRAAEALGRHEEARRHYQNGARYPAAYYGQLARARLGLGGIVLPPTPHPSAQERAALSQLEVIRAAKILYEIDEPGLVVSMAADLADRPTDPDVLAMLAEIAMHHKDARTVLQIGQGGLSRGLPFEMHAFPIVGLPRYTPVGQQVEPAIAYSIARQESGFNPNAVSRAKAYGLMQVTAGTGKLIAKRHGLPFSAKRLLSDPAYNVQLGAAELGDVLDDYRGSYILAFVAYNAGRGRVKQWIERYGDPRDPDVDPIDWVERIPFSETRNYVQRILENMQVYRVRFGSSRKLLIEADLRRGTNGP